MEDGELSCLRLAKVGYGGGNPKTIGQMDSHWVISMLQYENFSNEWENEYKNLNEDNG